MTKKRSCFKSFTKEIEQLVEMENDPRPHIELPVDWDKVDEIKDEELNQKNEQEDAKAISAVEQKYGDKSQLPSSLSVSTASPLTKAALGGLNLKFNQHNTLASFKENLAKQKEEHLKIAKQERESKRKHIPAALKKVTMENDNPFDILKNNESKRIRKKPRFVSENMPCKKPRLRPLMHQLTKLKERNNVEQKVVPHSVQLKFNKDEYHKFQVIALKKFLVGLRKRAEVAEIKIENQKKDKQENPGPYTEEQTENEKKQPLKKLKFTEKVKLWFKNKRKGLVKKIRNTNNEDENEPDSDQYEEIEDEGSVTDLKREDEEKKKENEKKLDQKFQTMNMLEVMLAANIQNRYNLKEGNAQLDPLRCCYEQKIKPENRCKRICKRPDHQQFFRDKDLNVKGKKQYEEEKQLFEKKNKKYRNEAKMPIYFLKSYNKIDNCFINPYLEGDALVHKSNRKMGCLCEDHAKYKEEYDKHMADVKKVAEIKKALTDDFGADKERYVKFRQDQRNVAVEYLNRMIEEPEEDLFVLYKPFDLFQEPDIWKVKTPQQSGIFQCILRKMGLDDFKNRWQWQGLRLQIMVKTFILFMLWSLITGIFFILGMLLYKEAIKNATSRVIDIMTKEQQEVLLHTITSEVEFSIELQNQLAEQRAVILSDTLARPQTDFVDYDELPIVSYRQMIKYGQRLKYLVHHREPWMLSPFQLANTRKLTFFNKFYEQSLGQLYGYQNPLLRIRQFYIQVQVGGSILYSYPPALSLPDKQSSIIDGYQIGDLTHDEMFQKTLRTRKTTVNFFVKDFETEKNDVIRFCTPITQGRLFWGSIYSEVGLTDLFEKTTVPKSFNYFKYPLMQVIYPTIPDSGVPGRIIYNLTKSQNLYDIEANSQFRAWKMKMMKKLYEYVSAKKHEGVFLGNLTLNVSRIDSHPNDNQYVFMAYALNGEGQQETIPLTRSVEDMNFMVVIGDFKYNTDTLISDCNLRYVDEVTRTLMIMVMFVIIGTNTFLISITVIQINIDVTNPVNELVKIMDNPENKTELEEYVKRIQTIDITQRIAMDKQKMHKKKIFQTELNKLKNAHLKNIRDIQQCEMFIRDWTKKIKTTKKQSVKNMYKVKLRFKLINFNRLETRIKSSQEKLRLFQIVYNKEPWNEVKMEIDEVLYLQQMFVRLFINSTDFTSLYVPAKIANIYNLDEISENSYKDLIMKNSLNNKIITMMEEGQSLNLSNRKIIILFRNSKDVLQTEQEYDSDLAEPPQKDQQPSYSRLSVEVKSLTADEQYTKVVKQLKDTKQQVYMANLCHCIGEHDDENKECQGIEPIPVKLYQSLNEKNNILLLASSYKKNNNNVTSATMLDQLRGSMMFQYRQTKKRIEDMKKQGKDGLDIIKEVDEQMSHYSKPQRDAISGGHGSDATDQDEHTKALLRRPGSKQASDNGSSWKPQKMTFNFRPTKLSQKAIYNGHKFASQSQYSLQLNKISQTGVSRQNRSNLKTGQLSAQKPRILKSDPKDSSDLESQFLRLLDEVQTQDSYFEMSEMQSFEPSSKPRSKPKSQSQNKELNSREKIAQILQYNSSDQEDLRKPKPDPQKKSSKRDGATPKPPSSKKSKKSSKKSEMDPQAIREKLDSGSSKKFQAEDYKSVEKQSIDLSNYTKSKSKSKKTKDSKSSRNRDKSKASKGKYKEDKEFETPGNPDQMDPMSYRSMNNDDEATPLKSQRSGKARSSKRAELK